VFYYITLMNENYAHPALPAGAEEGILRGIYLFRAGKVKKGQPKVQLLGSGAILREVIAGAELLEQDFGVAADIWSVTSFNQLRRDGLDAQHWNLLHPEANPRRAYIETCLEKHEGPIIAATDYMKLFADQVRAFLPGRVYSVLGTDGFGRSDTRKKLRRFFEVDRHHIAVAALKSLADQKVLPASQVSAAIKQYGIDPDKPNPATI